MEKLLNFEVTNEQTITSREIAELTNKNHAHVMRDCRVLNDNYENMNLSKIGLVNYTDKKRELRPMFLLTKMQTMDLMTGYSVELRIKVNRRWEELENKVATLPTYSEALRQLATSLELQEATTVELVQAKETIEENKPKVVFADAVSGSSNLILIRELAKVISDDNFKIGQNKLFQWMRENSFINTKNEPYQNYIEQGLFEVIERTIGSGEATFTSRTTKVTGKGQVYFTKKVRIEFL